MEKKLGLVFSGGGARGIVHIGAIQALREAKIMPDFLSGTSAGSIAGAMMAAHCTTEQMLQFVKENSLLKLISFGFPSRGLTDLSYLRKKLSTYIPYQTFSELPIPLTVAISNLNTGKVEYRMDGDLITTIVASCTVPVIFKPVEMDGHAYVDGGLLANAPVKPLKSKCDMIICVNLVPRVSVGNDELSSIFQIMRRCFDLSVLNNIKPDLSKSDVVIEPQLLKDYTRYSISKVDELYELGYTETKRMIPEILAKWKKLNSEAQSTTD